MKQQLYEENNADKHLVVGSIEILGDLKNDGIATIRQNISAIQQQNSAFAMDQQTAWQNLADDGVITPVEKKTVYREYQNILKSYSALEMQAINKNLQNEKFFRDYIATYTELKNYLNVTLKLFDDMESNTTLTDTQQKSFDTYFANYYGSEKYTTLALSYGAMGNLGFTVLESLSDPGTEGEVGLYRGQIYQYVTDHWEAVGLEGYIGVAEALPTGASLNQYFLNVAEDGFTAFEPLLINGEVLLVNDNKQVFVDKLYEYSYIYLNAGDHWQKVSDKTDYRYVVAMTDLVNYTGQLPGVYQKAIDDAIADVKKDIKQPSYYGVRSTAPANPKDGDYFVYSGTSTSDITYAHVLRWSESQNKWEDLKPDSNVYSNYYMQALEGILSITNPGEGYFTTIFARSFFGHQATMEALSTNTIVLTGAYGKIISSVPAYSANKQGLLINSDGNIDANENVHIGGKCTIDGKNTAASDYALDVSGKARISGSCDITGNGVIQGSIRSKNWVSKTKGWYLPGVDDSEEAQINTLRCNHIKTDNQLQINKLYVPNFIKLGTPDELIIDGRIFSSKMNSYDTSYSWGTLASLLITPFAAESQYQRVRRFACRGYMYYPYYGDNLPFALGDQHIIAVIVVHYGSSVSSLSLINIDGKVSSMGLSDTDKFYFIMA